MNKIHVIGIGYKPLDEKVRGIIYSSTVILASKRLFEVFRGYNEFETVRDRIKVIKSVDETIGFIRKKYREESMVVLASGDPMFFGIGRRVLNEFGKDAVEISPDLSSIQLAFSRIKEVWDDAFLMSLHGGPDPLKRRRLPFGINDIPSLLERHKKLAILTDRENNPVEIAKVLGSSAAGSRLSPRIYVCERLGSDDEKIIGGMPAEIAGMSFAEPNVVIIVGADLPPEKAEPAYGLRESEISHLRGLITKDEIRAVTIHKLRLPRKGVFWDIGAGSGSVSIESARLFPGLKVFAIEKDKEQIDVAGENRTRFNTPNIEIIEGAAPDALEGLPSPDRVFVGGSGARLGSIIRYIRGKMPSGIVVINAATIETLNQAVMHLEEAGYMPGISQVSVARSKTIKGGRHLSALNPIFIITGERDRDAG